MRSIELLLQIRIPFLQSRKLVRLLIRCHKHALFTSANGGWEYPAFLSIATLVTALLGNGARDEMDVRLPGSTSLRTAS